MIIFLISHRIFLISHRIFLISHRNNFSYFSSQPYVVTTHLTCLVETIQMKGRNLHFYTELVKIIPYYHQIHPLI